MYANYCQINNFQRIINEQRQQYLRSRCPKYGNLQNALRYRFLLKERRRIDLNRQNTIKRNISKSNDLIIQNVNLVDQVSTNQ